MSGDARRGHFGRPAAAERERGRVEGRAEIAAKVEDLVWRFEGPWRLYSGLDCAESLRVHVLAAPAGQDEEAGR